VPQIPAVGMEWGFLMLLDDVEEPLSWLRTNSDVMGNRRYQEDGIFPDVLDFLSVTGVW